VRHETALDVDREPHGSSDDETLVDFSANTNPETPAGVEMVYREAFEDARRYPPEPPTAYCEAAAAFVDCAPEQVIPTPGGLAAIRLVIDLAVEPGDSVLVPAPGFAEYAREVRLQGGDCAFYPEDDLDAVDPEGHALAVVCRPNNPTGTVYEPASLDAFLRRCRATDTLVLADEAFLGFTDRASLAGSEGVVVARSLTKLFGLPGLRAGFAVGTGAHREALRRARRVWNLGSAALATGEYCLRQQAFVDRTRERVRDERNRLQTRLADSFEVTASGGPFLLLDVGDRSVDAVVDGARERGIAIRDATTFRGLDSHVRVAVRLPTENDRLLEVLRAV
jgi:histidinol-phosphate/aromatic aminotransferase/cobyric acid decarboxylase-like protein